MKARVVVQLFYALFGALFLAAGLGVLLLDTGLLPPGAWKAALDFARGNLDTLHVMQEYGALLVFVGLITLWFARRYGESRPFHWAMTSAWALHALVHWFDVRGERSFVGPLINTAPFILFLLAGLLRFKAREKKKKTGGELLPGLPAEFKTPV